MQASCRSSKNNNMLDPEPTIEYALESQWSERILTLGFIRGTLRLTRQNPAYYYYHNEWQICAYDHLANPAVVTAVVTVEVFHRHRSHNVIATPAHHAYRYATMLVRCIQSNPSVKDFNAAHVNILQKVNVCYARPRANP